MRLRRAAETEDARRKERHTHDVRAERRRVTVPPDPRAGRIPGHEALDEALGLDLRYARGVVAKPEELVRQRIRLSDRVRRVVIRVAEVPDRPEGGVPAEVNLAEIDALDELDQLALAVGVDQIADVDESVRDRRRLGHAPSSGRGGASRASTPGE